MMKTTTKLQSVAHAALPLDCGGYEVFTRHGHENAHHRIFDQRIAQGVVDGLMQSDYGWKRGLVHRFMRDLKPDVEALKDAAFTYRQVGRFSTLYLPIVASNQKSTDVAVDYINNLAETETATSAIELLAVYGGNDLSAAQDERSEQVIGALNALKPEAYRIGLFSGQAATNSVATIA